jgi:hypothetical protein
MAVYYENHTKPCKKMQSAQMLQDAGHTVTTVLKRKHGEQLVSVTGDNSEMPDHKHLCLKRPFV